MPDITWYLNKAPRDGFPHPAYTDALLDEGTFFTYNKSWAEQTANPPEPTETINYMQDPTVDDAINGYRTYVDIWVAPNPEQPIRWTKIVIDETLSGYVFAVPEDNNNNRKILEQGIVIYRGRRRNSNTPLNIRQFLGVVIGSDTEIRFRYRGGRPRTRQNDTVFKFDFYITHPRLGSSFLHEKSLPDDEDVVKIDPIIHNDGSGPPP